MMRDVGRLGETYFQKLCNEVGLKANKSGDNDSTGWDFIVELPDDNLGLSVLNNLEKDFSKTICKFQIKSSDSFPSKQNIKLSNLKRFANEPVPAFFVFFEFDKKNEPLKMYLVHVGQDVVSRTIKRLRESDIKKESDIHKARMQISYDEKNELSPITGLGLKAAIQKHIGNNTHLYVKEKIEFINSVGFDLDRISVSFSTRGEDKIESMVNSLLGFKNSFTDVENLKISEKRFGLQKDLSHQIAAQILIGPSQNLEKVQLVCIEKTGNELSRIEADLYSPGILLQSVPDKLKKIRFKSKFFELIMNVHTREANIHLNLPNDLQPTELFECFEQIHFFFKLIETQIIAIERKNEEMYPFEFTINNLGSPEDLKEIYDLLGHACQILKANGIYRCISPLKLLEMQKSHILVYVHSLSPLPNSSFATDLLDKGTFQYPLKVAWIWTYAINFSEYFIGASIAFTGDATVEIKSGRERISFIDPKPIANELIKKKSKIDKSVLLDLEEKVKTKISEQGYEYITQKRN